MTPEVVLLNTDVSICEQLFAVVAGLHLTLVPSTCSQLVVLEHG